MAKWANAIVIENGPDEIRDRATAGTVQERIVKAYTAGDTYATVVANTCMSVTIAGADCTWADGASGARVMTIAGKTAVSVAADSGAAPDLHLVVTDNTNSVVLVATDETTNQVLATTDAARDIPAWTLTVSQPA